MATWQDDSFEAFSEQPISLIDANDRWCGAFDLDLDDSTLIDFYEDLLRMRLLDERLNTLLRTGKTSFVAPCSGHEAAQTGIGRAMRRHHDWLFPYYRDQGLAVLLSSADEVLAQFQASCSDRNKARQMPGHPGSDQAHIFTVASSIAAQIPPAVGAAMAKQVQRSDEVVVTTFGDGATSEGDWHTAMNLAAVRKAPIVFACENNGYAISVRLAAQTATATIAEKARAYGMPGYRVDGMDVLACHYVMKQAIARARRGEGPALVDMAVYRYGPHSSSDDDSVYRAADEVAAWKKRDPIDRFYRFLAARNLIDEGADKALRERIKGELAAAGERAGAAGTAPVEWLFDDVLAELPWHLVDQRELLLGEVGGS